MTADRLDSETEARIGEVCGSSGWVTFHEADPDCCCRQIRAAILAEREAREKHADALAEALRGIVNEAGLEFSDPRVSYETWQLDLGAVERGRSALAAHDKRRGK